MTGAIITTAALALLCSIIVRIGRFAMSRDFPDFVFDARSDFLMDAELAMRYMQYLQATRLFYLQAWALWGLLGILLVVQLLVSLPGA